MLPADLARRLACDARIIPAVLGTASEVLDLGRATRLPSSAQRRAVWLRDRHCRWPGCRRGRTSHETMHIHHVRYWADGGPTELTNLVLLCHHHHRLVHEHHWRLQMTAAATVIVHHPPDPTRSGRRRLFGITRPPP